MGICCSAAETATARYPALAVLGDLKIAFVFLTTYIFFAIWAFNTYLATTIYPFWGIIPIVFLNILGVLALSALYTTKTSDPGYVHEDWDSNISPDGMADWGLCKTCKLTLPPRAYHCRQANRCVLRYDHWCPWADNPVGFFNYKQYFLLLGYGVWSTSMIFSGCMLLFYNHYISGTLEGPLSSMIWPLFVATCAVLFSLTPLFLFHIRLLRMNLSTKEWYAQLREEGKHESAMLTYSKWDLGLLRNIEQLFGPDWRQWWNPWVKGPRDPGTSFPKNAVHPRQAGISDSKRD